jgi:hypothetical protein
MNVDPSILSAIRIHDLCFLKEHIHECTIQDKLILWMVKNKHFSDTIFHYFHHILHFDLNGFDSRGKTALYYSILNKDYSIARKLIYLGADVNMGFPIFLVIRQNQYKLLEELLSHGGIIDIQNNAGMNPIEEAGSLQYNNIVHLLTQ